MGRFGRWALWGAGGLAALLLVAAVGIWIASQMVLDRRWPVPAGGVAAARDPGAAARGFIVATRFGCTDCHGRDLTGTKVYDEPGIGRFWAPNLTRIVGGYSDAEIDHAVRAGLRPSGQGIWVMTSEAFRYLDDTEVADLAAYLRTLKPRGPVRPPKLAQPKGRVGVLLGLFKSAPQKIADMPPQPLPDYGPGLAQGRRLARMCVECHGQRLQGDSFVGSPDLTVAAAYDPADFRRLLRTGVAAGNRRLGLMSDSAPVRFSGMSDAEIDALQAYLKARAARQPPA